MPAATRASAATVVEVERAVDAAQNVTLAPDLAKRLNAGMSHINGATLDDDGGAGRPACWNWQPPR